MPKKKGGKKKGKKRGKKKVMVGNESPEQVLKRLLRAYDRNCQTSESLICPGVRSAIRQAAEEDKLLSKFVVEPVAVTSKDDPVVCLEPFLAALRQERYTFIKALHVWDIPLEHQHVASLALLLEKSVYDVHTLELMDCLVKAESVKRLALSFNACPSLSTIILDYNEFGDAGCKDLCLGLHGNKTVLSVSMNYCCLEVAAGKMLGQMVSTTAVRELYLDGNDLECEGVIEIIKMCVDKSEEEAFLREEEVRLKVEEEAMASHMEKEQKRLGSTYGTASEAEESDKDKPGSASKGKAKKKKKGKKKKKKAPPPPPPVGPWIYKLHIADNSVDSLGAGGQLAPLVCVRLLRRLITSSKCLEELDLDDNLIGDLGGKEMMEALQDRKDAGLGGIKLRTTHRMNCDTFNTIVKLGAGLKKKKKKRGKKKKK